MCVGVTVWFGWGGVERMFSVNGPVNNCTVKPAYNRTTRDRIFSVAGNFLLIQAMNLN